MPLTFESRSIGLGKEGSFVSEVFVLRTPRAEGRAADVEPDFVLEGGPGELVHLENVVQKFDQLERALADFVHLRRLANRSQVLAYVMHAASGWRDDVLEPGKVLHEQGFGGRSVALAAAVAHRLPAARLVKRVDHVQAEALE